MPYGKRTHGKPRRFKKAGMSKTLPKSDLRPVKKTAFRNFGAVRQYGLKPIPFPVRMKHTMVYSHSENLYTNATNYVQSSSLQQINVIKPTRPLNSISRTVQAYDQIKAIYSNYLVTGLKIQWTVTDPSADGLRTALRLLVNGAFSLNGQYMSDVIEQPYTYVNAISNTGAQKKVYNVYVSPWQLMGISKMEYFANSSKYQGNWSDASTPSMWQSAIVECGALNQSSTICDYSSDIKLTYYLESFNRKPLFANTSPAS